jgi:glycosyltransferase involved in cell wall biosynthesis
MKIVHYFEYVRKEDGGIVRAVIDMCTLLAAQGHEVIFLSADPKDVPPAWRQALPSTPRLVDIGGRLPGGFLSPRAARAARAVLKGADALHLHGTWHRSNLQISLAALAEDVPYVWSMHGMLDDWATSLKAPKKRIYMALVVRGMIRRCSAIVCAASGELDDSCKWFPRQKGRVIPLVFDLEPFRRLPGPELAQAHFPPLKAGSPTILFLSRLVENKGPDLVIAAVSLLRAQGTAVNLVVAGSGDPAYERSLRAQVRQLQLQDQTTFTGHIEGDLKLSLLQACDLFILPTVHENFGFATLEAIACGRPAITTKGTMIWRELEEGGGAIIVDRTAEAIADAVAPLLADQSRRDAIGHAGRDWVFDFLDPARLVTHYGELYRLTAPSGREARSRTRVEGADTQMEPACEPPTTRSV